MSDVDINRVNRQYAQGPKQDRKAQLKQKIETSAPQKSVKSKLRSAGDRESPDHSFEGVSDFVQFVADTFRRLDRNKDGVLDKREILKALASDRKFAKAYREHGAVFRELDSDGSGDLSFQEFIEAFLQWKFELPNEDIRTMHSIFTTIADSKMKTGSKASSPAGPSVITKREFVTALVKDVKIAAWMKERDTYAYTFAQLDANADRVVDWIEFLCWFVSKAATHEVTKQQTRLSARAAWEKLDRNKDGKVSAKELAKSASQFPEIQKYLGFPTPSARRARDMFAKLDADGSGEITYAEFTQVFGIW